MCSIARSNMNHADEEGPWAANPTSLPETVKGTALSQAWLSLRPSRARRVVSREALVVGG